MEDAPGLFAHTQGIAQFDVVHNEICGYTQRDTDITERELKKIPFEVKKISETEYYGTVHSDTIMDEDHYKNGICHWSLTDVRMTFGHTDNTG